MEQSQWERTLSALQTHLSQLEESLSARTQRFTPFKNLFNDLHKACDRFAASLVALADACDQDILSTRYFFPMQSQNRRNFLLERLWLSGRDCSGLLNAGGLLLVERRTRYWSL
jgi:hypothetical protein